jgi:hypothetical protein
LRRHLYTRPATQQDLEKFIQWSAATPNNGFDPDVPAYPSTITWCAYDSEGPLAFMPVQAPLMLDSLATRPGATKLEIAAALKELTQNAVTQCHIRGAGELYFLGSDKGTNFMAENQIFEKTDFTVYRLKIKDLEKHD